MLSRITSSTTIEFKTRRPYLLSQESQSSRGLQTNLSWKVTYELNLAIGKHATTQKVYFCDKVDRFYFSKKVCLDKHKLPYQFPYPMSINNSPHTSPALVVATTTTQIKSPADTTTQSTSTTHPQLPQQPLRLPHLATAENIPRLWKYLLDQFRDTTFNRSTTFSVISTKTANQI